MTGLRLALTNFILLLCISLCYAQTGIDQNDTAHRNCVLGGQDFNLNASTRECLKSNCCNPGFHCGPTFTLTPTICGCATVTPTPIPIPKCCFCGNCSITEFPCIDNFVGNDAQCASLCSSIGCSNHDLGGFPLNRCETGCAGAATTTPNFPPTRTPTRTP